jgi:hypothetical protein
VLGQYRIGSGGIGPDVEQHACQTDTDATPVAGRHRRYSGARRRARVAECEEQADARAPHDDQSAAQGAMPDAIIATGINTLSSTGKA